MKKIDVLTKILLVVGGLNWGLVGLANFDLVARVFGMHFGEKNVLTAVVYLLVGVSGLYQLLAWKAMQRRWAEPMAASHR